MKADKIRSFMKLAGQQIPDSFSVGDDRRRELGAKLLLSETLEYVIAGLGVVPEVDGVPITEPDNLTYRAAHDPDHIEMLDGLADVAYTMYWNSTAFALRLEEAFERVCDNNLGKFVLLSDWKDGEQVLEASEWGCGVGVTWPEEVVVVAVVEVDERFYAVGKDASGKVRKPSTYRPVDLSTLAA